MRRITELTAVAACRRPDDGTRHRDTDTRHWQGSFPTAGCASASAVPTTKMLAEPRGSGVQLLAMGKGYAINDSFSQHDVVIASDDNGKHWRTTHIFNGTDGVGLDEPQLALLPNGDVMANMRTGVRNCPGFYSGAACRAISSSTNQGETFVRDHNSLLRLYLVEFSQLVVTRTHWVSFRVPWGTMAH